MTGGPERYLFNVIHSLESRGHKIVPFSVKTSKNEQSRFSDYFADNIGMSDEVLVSKYPKTLRTYFDLILREFYSLGVKKRLDKLIKKEKPDVCYLLAYKRSLSPSVIDACYNNRIPIVNRLSDYNPVCLSAHLYNDGQLCEKCVGKSKISCVKYRCLKKSLFFSTIRYLSHCFHRLFKFDSKISRFVCTNRFMLDLLIKDGVNPNKLVLLPTYFNERDIKVKRTNSNIVRNKVVFLYIGSLAEIKGLKDLLNVFSKLKDSHPNFMLNIVGGIDKEEVNSVLKLINELGLSEFICFSEFKSNEAVFEYYIESNVTVLPSRIYENLPNTLLESIYYNRPVVVPRMGSFLYTVDDTVSYKYEPFNLDSLRDVLISILDNPNTIIEKTACCDRFYQNNFSESSHLNKLIDIFENFQNINRTER